MPDDKLDPERLAALLDGRLAEHERAELVARLANADDSLLGALADAASVLRADVPEARSLRFPRRRRWRRITYPLAAAAVLILAALATLKRYPRGGVGDPLDVATRVGFAPPSPAAIGWPVYRSSSAPISDRARRIRLGRWLADFSMSRDSATTARCAAEIAQLLNDTPGMADVSVIYGQRSTGVAIPDSIMHTAARAIASRLGDDVWRGEWVELTRAAAESRTAQFFAAPETRTAVDWLERTAPTNQSAAFSYLSKLVREEPLNWAAVDSVATDALKTLGR